MLGVRALLFRLWISIKPTKRQGERTAGHSPCEVLACSDPFLLEGGQIITEGLLSGDREREFKSLALCKRRCTMSPSSSHSMACPFSLEIQSNLGSVSGVAGLLFRVDLSSGHLAPVGRNCPRKKQKDNGNAVSQPDDRQRTPSPALQTVSAQPWRTSSPQTHKSLLPSGYFFRSARSITASEACERQSAGLVQRLLRGPIVGPEHARVIKQRHKPDCGSCSCEPLSCTMKPRVTPTRA